MIFQADCSSRLHYSDERQGWDSTSGRKKLAFTGIYTQVVGIHELHDQHAEEVRVGERGGHLPLWQATQQVAQTAGLSAGRMIRGEQAEDLVMQLAVVFGGNGAATALHQQFWIHVASEWHDLALEPQRVRHRQRAQADRDGNSEHPRKKPVSSPETADNTPNS